MGVDRSEGKELEAAVQAPAGDPGSATTAAAAALSSRRLLRFRRVEDFTFSLSRQSFFPTADLSFFSFSSHRQGSSLRFLHRLSVSQLPRCFFPLFGLGSRRPLGSSDCFT